MGDTTAAQVAIVDYGLGNLFSVKRACEYAGLTAAVTNECDVIGGAEAVILPGVGAFGDAMATLRSLDLVEVLRDVAASGNILVGVCLGVQLLMSESHEFGRHKGLGIVEGPVVRLPHPREGERELKVPQVGWNRIRAARPWDGTLLAGVPADTHMYFVHSFIVQPQDPALVVSTSRYGQVEFCSSLSQGHVFACQFHPERSGAVGLQVYRNLAALMQHAPKEPLHG